MKAMEAELGMYKQQVDVFKSGIESSAEAMRALRHRWVADQRHKSDQLGNQSASTAWGSTGMEAAAAAPSDTPNLNH